MPVQLHLLDIQSGTAVDLPLADPDRELLGDQVKRCREYGGLDLFVQRLGRAFASALRSTVDHDLRPPSDPQVKYAMAIARTLSIALSPDVLRYRGAMHVFLSAHKEAFEVRRGAPSNGLPAIVERGNGAEDDQREHHPCNQTSNPEEPA